MELKDYIRIVLKNWYFFIAVILVLIVNEMLSYQSNPVSYQGSTTFIVGNSSVQEESVLDYDNYYNVLGSGAVADILDSMITSPNTISRIYNDANVNMEVADLSKISKLIKTSKTTPTSSVIVAKVENSSKQNTEKILNSTNKIIKQDFGELISKKAVSEDFILVPSEIYVSEIRKNYMLEMIIAIVAGFIIASGLVFLKDALIPKK